MVMITAYLCWPTALDRQKICWTRKQRNAGSSGNFVKKKESRTSRIFPTKAIANGMLGNVDHIACGITFRRQNVNLLTVYNDGTHRFVRKGQRFFASSVAHADVKSKRKALTNER